jgi:thiosulfate/3-mercaptopyruvate sulfurtransferase
MNGLAPTGVLATTDWLAGNLDQPDLVLVDARWRPDGSAPSVFADGHVPGAGRVDWRSDLIAEPRPETPGALRVADAIQVSAVAGRLGIGRDSTVVVYDDSQGLFAARTWWTMRTYGVASVKVLDGGYPAWVAEGRATTTVDRPRGAVDVALQGPDRTCVTTTDVRALLGSPGVLLLDARAAADYRGFEGNTRRLGHIPGAINVPVGATSQPGNHHLRDLPQLRARLEAASVPRGKRLICYDGSGVAAAKLAYVLAVLGYDDVAVYDGGWAEWGDRLDLPVDR